MNRPSIMQLAILTSVVLLLSPAISAASPRPVQRPDAKQPPVDKVSPPPEFSATNGTSFEQEKAGHFKTLETRVGKWTTSTGTALIDNKHATTGRQCLQLSGGKETTVELEIADGINTSGNLSFRAERWTKRDPFSFRIAKRSSGKWTEIYNGGSEIRVGRPFLSDVDVALDDPNIDRLRLTVVSPPNTGILIDDLRIAPPQPQQITNVEVVPFALPALVGADHSPLLKVKIETTGRINPLAITKLQASLNGTADIRDIATVQTFYGSSSGNFAADSAFGSESKPANQVTFSGKQLLAEGTNYVWLACKLNESANIDHRVGAVCEALEFSNGKSVDFQSTPSIQNMGVRVRDGGDDGVHTYRIPGLATTKKGSLIAVYDVRRRSGGDLPGDIDVGMSRSTDGGRTWEPMKIIMDMGDNPDFRYDGIGDPTVLADKTTGTVWCGATWSHGNRSWFGSRPGLEPIDTGQFILVRSDDDGVTWSKPINITKQVKKPEWSFLLQGPGKGITMSNGTIVFPAQYQDPPNKTDKRANRLPHSAFIFSRDHGETWDTSTGAYDDTTEAQVVELADDQIMINCRYNRDSKRVVMTTGDMGKTWDEHPTNRKSLIEPGACMASLINVGRELRLLGVHDAIADRDDFLLFSNPDSSRGRNHITIKASQDGGLTWPNRHHLLLDEQDGRGYSCLTMIDSETVGIIYEGSQAHMTFQRVKLADILKPPTNQKTKNPAKTAEVSSNATAAPDRLKEDFALARVFGDHMVLQAQQPIRIWGHAKSGAEVSVALGTATAQTKAASNGRWQVTFPAQPHNNTPQALTAASGDTTDSVSDILIGEVWLCAGQSNMEWPLSKSIGGKEAVADSEDAQLRLMNFAGAARGGSGVYTAAMMERLTPDRFSSGVWEVAGPASSPEFSGVGYYFAKELRKKLDCPIGIINVSIGGTPIEAWVSSESLAQHPTLQQMMRGRWLDNVALDEWCRTRATYNLQRSLDGELAAPGDQYGPNHSFKPGFMYDAGIKPFTPMSIRGALWYQGESNGDNPDRTRQYDAAFPLLVSSWRNAFQNENMPVAFVQLPAMGRPNWPVFREYQRRSLTRLDNVGMAITIDTGDRRNVHPGEKQPVGQRLAAWALTKTYGQPGPAMGPLYQSKKVDGESLVLTFDTDGDKLVTAAAEAPNNFEIAGDDGIFYPATAKMSGNQVSLHSKNVPQPKNARYAWADFPELKPNLFNASGMPASPFTTEARIPDGRPVNDDDRPNILLIVGEDHGCELSCYGDPVITTPNIDRLASQGVLFENGYVTQSVCSPSRSTIFTGLYPHQNGQLGLATHQYGWFRKWPTTYSLLKQSGYRTGLIGKTHVIPADAVESFVDFRFQKSSNFAKRKVSDYAVKAGEFFGAGDEPFFMTVNYPDAHWPLQGQVGGLPETQVDPNKVKVMPYVGDETPRLRDVARNYYDCMLRLDHCVGQLLEQLENSGKADNTLVIFIGDHGAQMARGKVTVYEGGMRVPYIVRWPGVTKTEHRSTDLVSTIDLLPTFMDAAKGEAPEGLPGKSLRPVLGGDTSEPFRTYLACERNCDAARHTFPQRTIRDARYKLIHSPVRNREDPAARYYRNHGAAHWAGCLTDEELAGASERTKAGYARWLNPPEYQLYDLKNDPHEWNDLSADPTRKETIQRLQSALTQWRMNTRDPLASPEKLRLLMEENDAVFKAGRRMPQDGWQYLKYLAPNDEQVIFQKRDIPQGTPREGHAKDDKMYGYRIPSLLVTQKGSILAFSERRLGLHDHAQNDIVLRRSTDNGESWSDEIVAYEDGMNSINDPLTVQLGNGRILLMFARFPYGRHARDAGWIKMADLGYDDPKANVLTFVCHSDDDGGTWSKPVDISRQVKHPRLLNANTPGAMIQLTKGIHKGRVVTGLWGTLPTMKDGKRSREWQIVVAYSDDNGKTWKRTEPLKDESDKGFSNECQVAEAANGDVVLISRNQGGDAFRKKAISHDGGETWSPLDVDRGLPSVACMGSVIKGPVKEDGTWDLWASFPSNTGRKDGQIAVSKDNGKSWRVVKVITGPFAYSALQVSPDRKSLLCLYESDGYRTETLLTIPFDKLRHNRAEAQH